ncbi:TMV resistance protein N [Arachis hypogaea]|nr:TMV resistance protein N [Arachis hypogaea]
MASRSSSASIPPPPRACTYHVFLSFRGEDTRRRFTSHLYDALNRKGITTYRDDNNLRKGNVISDALLKAIEESMFAIIVLSPNYASSTWCLAELCKILDCKNKLGLQMVTVFYGVEPSVVRHQIGTFQKAFKKHKKRHDREKVQRWREALKQVADYSGWTSKNQSLVTIEYDSLGMHDLLEEMGKQIVIQESPNDASKRSRLWCYEDVDFVLTQKKKTKATHGIVLRKKYSETEVNQRDLSFSKMYHQRYELVEINLYDSQIVQLWDGKKVLEKLEHLDLSWCKQLKQTPDLSGAPNLKKLNLQGCKKLDYIHPSLTHHKRLVELDLGYCERLETLGDKLEISSLEKLDLYRCSSLRRLPEFGECMKQLSILDLEKTGIEELPPTLGKLAGVSELDLTGCYKLTSLPFPLGCFVGLKKLKLNRFVELSCVPYTTHGLESLEAWDFSDSPILVGLLCSLSRLTSLSSLKLHGEFSRSREVSTLYYDLGHLTSLADLDLGYSDFLRVPICIHALPRLTRLDLCYCYNLEVLPELPSSLRELQAKCFDSLVASNVNAAISKACCGFAESASQDREDLLQMWISRKKMPAWFKDQEKDNGISVSFPHNCPSTETIALALCFLLQGVMDLPEQPSVICNGKEFINKSVFHGDLRLKSKYLCIVCVNGYYFSNMLCQDNRFQLQFPSDYRGIRVQRSGARWVCKQDIQHFKQLASRRSSDPPELLPLFPLHSHSTWFS